MDDKELTHKKEFWPLLIGGWGAVITAFSSPYYSQGVYYATQFLSYGYYALCLTPLLLGYRKWLNNSSNERLSFTLVCIACTVMLSSPIIVQSELLFSQVLAISPSLNRLFSLEHHTNVLNEGLWWRSAQLILFQVSALTALAGVRYIREAYRESLRFLGLSKNLHQALFRIRAGYVGEGFITETLGRIATLSESSPDEAEALVEDLGELVRYALETSQSTHVNIDLEVRALNIYLRLYQKVMMDEKESCTLHTAENLQAMSVLPMSALGLVAHVLGYFASSDHSYRHWEINIHLQQRAHLFETNIIVSPTQQITPDAFEIYVTQLDNEVLDSMRFRLEQAYPGGSYIEFSHKHNLHITLIIPYYE